MLLLFLDHKYTKRYIYIWIRFRHSRVSSIVKLVFVTNLSRWIFPYIDCLNSLIINPKFDNSLCCNGTRSLISILCVRHLVIYFRVTDKRTSSRSPTLMPLQYTEYLQL